MRSSLHRRCFCKKLALLLLYLSCLIGSIVLLFLSLSAKPQIKVNNQDIEPIHSKLESTITLSSLRSMPGIEKSQERCELIHIAVLCGGAEATRGFYVLLKSILFQRTTLIHLHLFVNDASYMILSKLFESWKVRELTFSFYNITIHEHEVSWIVNKHYSQRFGLLKLLVLSILREEHELQKVIMLDTDMLVLGNIYEVWKQFNNFNSSSGSAIFGMVENQSEWYLGMGEQARLHQVWRALGRGYNSGLILVNLEQLREIDWTQLWRETTELELTSHLTTLLADQDILNSIIKSNPRFVAKLDCRFNIQLNDHTDLDRMCPDKNEFKIIHWNSPNKLATKNPRSSLYNNWYISMRNWNGKLLEKSYCDSTDLRKDTTLSNSTSGSNLCDDLKPSPEEKLRTYVYFMGFELSPDEHRGVTLVVHLSIDRLQMLDNLAFNWQGPISVALYLSELETELLLESIENSNNLANRKNIGYHLVFRDHGFNYPINRLRNIALDNSITPFVFLSDVDFLPSIGLYNYLIQFISSMNTSESSTNPLERRALVIPAFENLQYKFEFPVSKSELLTQLNLGYVSMFRDRIWPKGHAPTNIARWKVSTKPYEVSWSPDYEPFIVTSRDVPRFDERFVGFGWNKVESIMMLAALRYDFIVLPDAFLIHKFHPASYDIMRHRESRRYRACIKHLKRSFLKEFHHRFPDFPGNLHEPKSGETL